MLARPCSRLSLCAATEMLDAELQFLKVAIAAKSQP
jgi:hypothetical protein